MFGGTTIHGFCLHRKWISRNFHKNIIFHVVSSLGTLFIMLFFSNSISACTCVASTILSAYKKGTYIRNIHDIYESVLYIYIHTYIYIPIFCTDMYKRYSVFKLEYFVSNVIWASWRLFTDWFRLTSKKYQRSVIPTLWVQSTGDRGIILIKG